MSQTTIDNERRVLNSFFSWLSDEGYINKNICSSIKKVRTEKKQKKAFSEVEVAKIKEACQWIESRNGVQLVILRKRALALVEFLLSTGCRVGEISTLKREDIDLELRTAVVLGKGNKERIVYLTQVAKMRLLEYWEVAGDDDYCFASLTRKDTGMAVSGIEIQIRELGEIAKVKNCYPHRFRRTCATTAIKKGMSLIDVQRMLGHSSIETTKIYLDLDNTNLAFMHDKFFN